MNKALLVMARFRRLAAAAFTLGLFMLFALPAHATKIERVVSPGGIEAWLVREPSVPLIAMEFAFYGGANQDPAEKPGVGNMVAALLDEGAGDLDSTAFQSRMEKNAVELGFRSQRDYFHGVLKMLRERQDEGFELMRLAINAPRFDAVAIERVRGQILTGLRRETTNPSNIASKLWWKTAFPDHAYGRPANGSLESVALIGASDLRDYVGRVFTRDRLKVAVVGDIDAQTLGAALDKLFGALPAKSTLLPVAAIALTTPHNVFAELNVPQAVLSFGSVGIARNDPDFIPAFVANHILGGGSFTSRLYREVREKRGLAYSVYSYLLPLDRTALFMGGTATSAAHADETMALIQSEIRRFVENGPTAEELAKAKSYLQGSYALNFDTSTKIAGLLVQVQIDNLGIDYIDRRNGLIQAVTLDDIKRVSKRLWGGGVMFSVVGRPAVTTVKKEGG